MDPDLAQVAQISWGPNRTLTRAEGSCEQVLGRSSQSLTGAPLHRVLEVDERRALELDGRARAGRGPAAEFVTAIRNDQPHTLRLVLGLSEGEPTAAILDLSVALAGAPPLQIAGLSSSLSHEIRNPLSSVKMAVQTLAKNTALSERDRRRLSIANREIRTMERMLWLLSEYGRDAPAILETVGLKALVQEAAALIEPELAGRKIQVGVLEDAHIPKVRMDASRLRPVLAQVLLNVAQSLPEGAGLEVRLVAADGGCSLLFEDPSVALPPEERPTLFEPFGSRLARGAGLSLAALRRVMLSFGGLIQAEGSDRPPTLFTLWFPG